jgi:DNA-binding transcriptional LysR family regulator
VELEWLRTFLAVVDRGGFTAASEQIHRSQSRVSAHIAALERNTGTILIDRSRRPATLTYPGEVFARYAREILATVGAAQSAVSALRGLDMGEIALLTTPCIGASVLPEVLTELMRQHAGARVDVIERSSLDVDQELLSEGVVLAVTPAEPGLLAPGVREQLLWSERIQLVVRAEHPLASTERPVRLAELMGERLVVAGGPSDTHSEIYQILTRIGLAGSIRATVQTPQSVLAFAEAGLGVGVLGSVAVASVATKSTVVLDIDDPDATRDVSAYWHDVLLSNSMGRTLHKLVLAAPVPAGARPTLDIDPVG